MTSTTSSDLASTTLNDGSPATLTSENALAVLAAAAGFLRRASKPVYLQREVPPEYTVIMGANCFMAFRQVGKNQATLKRLRRLWR